MIERQREIVFEYQSKMKDIGFYRKSFILKRMTDGHFARIAYLKSQMTGGIPPIDQFESQYLNALAHLQVLCEPIPAPGEKVEDTWLEDILDSTLKLSLFKRLMDYQMSFFEVPDANSATPSSV